MKKTVAILLIVTALSISEKSHAQCSVCTKTTAQMGEKPARGMNSGILYLMATPFLIVGYIGYRWWKSNRD